MKKTAESLVIANEAQMKGYIDGHKLRQGNLERFEDVQAALKKGRFERFETIESTMALARQGGHTAASLGKAIQANPGIKTMLPASTQAHLAAGNLGVAAQDLNSVSTGGNPIINAGQYSMNGGNPVDMGGPWNSKLPTKATVLLNIGAPMVTAAGSGTAAPDSGTYVLPLFGIMASKSNYAFGGILQGPQGHNYKGYALSGAILFNNGATLPAPFAAVPINPAVWYIVYVDSTDPAAVKGAMWTLNTSQSKIPYTMFLESIWATYFTVSRFRYILQNQAQTEQFGFSFEELSFGGWGKGSYNTMDPPMFKSPEQNQAGITDVETPVDIGPENLLVVGTDPTVVTAGFQFGLFNTQISRRPQASNG